MKVRMLTNVAVKREFDSLEDEFTIFEQLIRARKRAGLSQAEVAKRMGTQVPAISRIESLSSKHSPSLRTLQRYARAVGCDLEFKLRPARKKR